MVSVEVFLQDEMIVPLQQFLSLPPSLIFSFSAHLLLCIGEGVFAPIERSRPMPLSVFDKASLDMQINQKLIAGAAHTSTHTHSLPSSPHCLCSCPCPVSLPSYRWRTLALLPSNWKNLRQLGEEEAVFCSTLLVASTTLRRK